MIYSMVIAKGETAVLSTLMFIAWVIIGVIIYASYGYRKNRETELRMEVCEENEKITGNI